MERDRICTTMTESEAREILHAQFSRFLRPGQEIWIGELLDAGDWGYTFNADIYCPDEGAPNKGPFYWTVRARERDAMPVF